MRFNNYDGCINTFSGKKFSFENPTIEQIDIYDIAKGLAFKAHFGGQTDNYFSIAQHTMLVISLMPSHWKNNYPLCMAALIHDASEAYTGDIVKPLKNLLPEFKVIEDRITEVIFEKFQISLDELKAIKPYDIEAQNIEYNTFYTKTNQLPYLSPERAFDEFMKEYHRIIIL